MKNNSSILSNILKDTVVYIDAANLERVTETT